MMTGEASAKRVVIVLRKGETEETRVVDAPDGCITLGRDSQNAVQLRTVQASRRHAMIAWRGARMSVRDVSMNGTRVGDTLLRHTEREFPGDSVVVIGEYQITIGSPALNCPDRTRGSAGTSDATPRERQVGTRGSAAASDATPRERQVGTHGSAGASGASAPDGQGRAIDSAATDVRARIHKLLLEHVDLSSFDVSRAHDPALRPRVLVALRQIVDRLRDAIPPGTDHDELIGSLADEALGLGPLEPFLSDPTVNEVMVVDPQTIYIERNGQLLRTDARFTDDDRVRAVIERIVTPLGRRIDESVPLVDARLSDGSRVNAIIRPLALRGSAITIRKFSRTPLTMQALIARGALSEQMATFLIRCVAAKKNIVIAGGTGSGKTTLLNVLSGAIPPGERIVTIEDAAELQLAQPHVVSLETRPANMEGRGQFTIRDLVKNALRMRPDRIVVGECRGGEALDMLQAMNTGHDGSLTTTHANSPREAVARLETLVMMGGLELPMRAIREQISKSVHVLVQQSRLDDGSRRVTSITEVTGLGDDGEIALVPIFEFVRTQTTAEGKALGEYRATGFLPSFLHEFLVKGLIKANEGYL